ncbi:hypothetical protein GALMADRAFT_231133 [Galerina marginata CBS 339.88]|uniref:Uncharacterized protein n=1 Tax=Galerina marginata (strain CBS 339.88) TaxID=685588 RepID=A0A067SD41_GALM3|nr:hypothetical protein GALMADRAFT_231133 [Galerina marginata CBS 339.88]
MANRLPEDLPNSTSHPRTRDQIPVMHLPSYLPTHVTPNPTHRAPVLGQFSPSPTPPRRNNTSKDVILVFCPSLEAFQWSTPPVTPERLSRSSTRIAPRSQLPANGFPATVLRCFDENPFINHAQSEWEPSSSANAESHSTTLTCPFPDDSFANSQSSNRASIQRTIVKDDPSSHFLTSLAGENDYYPIRRSAFRRSTITSGAQSSLATPPATARKLRPTTFVPQGTPVRKSLQLDALQTPPVKLETRPSFFTPPSTIQVQAGIYQSPEDTPLRRPNFMPTAGSVNELSPSRPSGTGSSKSLAKKDRTKTDVVPSNDIMDLARIINKRSSRNRNRGTHPVISESNEMAVAVESSSDALPRQFQSWFFEGSAGIFKNGQKLILYFIYLILDYFM